MEIQGLREARELWKQKRKEEALALYEALLREHGESPVVLREYGKALYAQYEDFEKALDLFERALKFEPECIDTLLYLAEIYRLGYGKGYTEVVPIYRRVLELVPDDLALRAEIYTGIGMAYETPSVEMSAQEALEAYTAAIACVPDNPIVHGNLAMFFYQRREHALARKEFVQARELAQKADISGHGYDEFIQRIDDGLSFSHGWYGTPGITPRWPDGDIR